MNNIIGIFGATGCNDFGDYAMLINDIKLMNKIDKNIIFKIFSYDVKNTKINLENNLNDVEINYEIVCDLSKKYNLLSKVINKLGKFINNTDIYKKYYWKKLWEDSYKSNFKNVNKKFIDDVNACDKIIFIGGGYIQNNWYLDNIKFMTEINCAHHLNKKIHFLGSTIGPIDKYEYYVSKSLNFVDSIMVRDNVLFSKKNLLKMGYKNTIVEGPDDLLFIENQVEQNEFKMKNYIILEVMPWIEKAEKGEEYIIHNLIEFCDYVIKYENKEVVLIGFYKNENKTTEYINNIMRKVKNKNKIHKILNIDNINYINEIYKNSDFSLSFRYHPVILALGNKKPCVGIITDNDGYYLSKFSGAISNLDLCIEDMILNLDEFDFNKITQMYLKLIKEFNIKDDKYKQLINIRNRYIKNIIQ